MFMDMQKKLMSQIDLKFEQERRTRGESGTPGPTVFIGSHPRSATATATAPSQPAGGGQDSDSLHAELQTVLPTSPSSADRQEVTVKQEPDSDIEILSSSPPSPPRPSRIAEEAATIDQASCRLHVTQACQVLGKAPGQIPDPATEATHASALTSLRHFRDQGMVPDPDVKIAWPHDDSLDRTQADYIASLQQREGSAPARDLFSLPAGSRSDRFLPLPNRRIPRDQWFYMTQTAAEPSWSTRAPVGSNMAREHPAPSHITLPHSQVVAQESNLRTISHLATMTDNATTAISQVLFQLYDRGLWPTEPIDMPGVSDPISFTWFISMFRLLSASTSQIAHNAVAAAMNLQMARREEFTTSATYKTGISAGDRDVMRVAPMNSPDLFGTQADNLQARRDLYDRTRPQRNTETITRLVRPGTTSSPPVQSAPPRSGSSSRKKKRKRKRSPSRSAQQSSTSSQQQSFRGGSSRGRANQGQPQQQPASRGRDSQRRGGGSGRSSSRKGGH